MHRTYSLPADVDDAIEQIRNRPAVRDMWLNQSEIVRAGICVLGTLPDDELRIIAEKIPRAKRGRPQKSG